MSEDNLPVVCRSCGNTVRMNQINFDDDSKQYICNSCFKSIKARRGESTNSSTTDSSAGNNNKIEKVSYQCAKCKYKFSKHKDKVPADCPYCGNGELEIVGNRAESLVDNADF